MGATSDIRKRPMTSVLLAISHALWLSGVLALGKASCHVASHHVEGPTWPRTEGGLLPTASENLRLANSHASGLRRGGSLG